MGARRSGFGIFSWFADTVTWLLSASQERGRFHRIRFVCDCAPANNLQQRPPVGLTDTKSFWAISVILIDDKTDNRIHMQRETLYD